MLSRLLVVVSSGLQFYVYLLRNFFSHAIIRIIEAAGVCRDFVDRRILYSRVIIMDDVQQRQQRLAAMREQAALEDASDGTDASSTVLASTLNLPNPMMDTSSGDLVGEKYRISGFDFYTDPLTAFTGSKRRKAVSGGELSQTSQIYQAPRPPPVYNPSALQFPPPPPFPGNQGWQPVPYQPPPPTGGPGPPPHFHHQPESFRSSQWNGRGTGMGYGNAGRGGRGNHFSGFPGQGRGNDNTNSGWNSGRGAPALGGDSFRGHYASDFSGQGRGNGSGRNNTWNSGRGTPISGRNFFGGSQSRGSQGRGGQRGGRAPSAKEQPHLYYKPSMLEDPWKELEEKLERKKAS
ncbi:hypothetical protein R1sor_016790 [Riccia sorocarpa]|uniref:Uncharacterized protein n=1 Tax=Riccia sorocarpa TaxID=122646 RepID=A0ABD3HHW7_9MARC